MSTIQGMSELFQFAESEHFGELHIKFDEATGLRAIVAIHSTKNGPALGGCRVIEYDTPEEAAVDAMRLAKAMSKKAAMVGLPLGGGKAVLMKPKHIADRRAYFEAYGRFVNDLGGRYITAVDSGSNLADMDVIATQTDFVAGTSDMNGAPSPYTAKGVLQGILAAVQYKLGRDDVGGLTVAIQGVGNVGHHLAELLHERGAELIITDHNEDHLRQVHKSTGATIVSPEEIHSVECDIFSPCALGAIINKTTLPEIKASIIAGAANNQLSVTEMGEACRERDILYAPDYIINAGGLIYAAALYLHHNDEKIERSIKNIHSALMGIFERAGKEGKATNSIANTMAEEKL